MNYYRWHLFLDDERFPISPHWFVARNSYQAIYAVQKWGMPESMALDHDLGGEDTTMVFLDKLQEFLENGGVEFPPDFEYSVHSQNPVGAKNIEDRMEFLLKYF